MRYGIGKTSAALCACAAVLLGTTVPAAAATGTANATVILREGASTSSAALATIREGDEVEVRSLSGDWALVEDGSRTGYIAARYLDIEGEVEEGDGGASLLRRGDENEAVRAMQEKLIGLGYLDTEATGYFGSATESALKKYQQDAGLSADGVAGEKTFAALEKAAQGGGQSASSGVLQQGDESEEVRDMQKRLIELNYLDTEATGFFGTATAAAVRAFQKDAGLSADGIAGAQTLTALNKSATNVSTVVPEEEEEETVVVQPTQVNGDIVLEDWWSGKLDSAIDYGDTYLVTDVLTGKSFTCARYGGDNHLDSEPLTAKDTATMYEIFGGEWTWSARAILLTYDGVTYAAAMNGMPHGGERITTNNFDGQFCIHFLNSRTHGGDQVNEDMQARIQEAYHSR